MPFCAISLLNFPSSKFQLITTNSVCLLPVYKSHDEQKVSVMAELEFDGAYTITLKKFPKRIKGNLWLRKAIAKYPTVVTMVINAWFA